MTQASLPPETLHLVFKTHLDIGFTDHAEAVRRQYHERFIPQAISTGTHFWREDPEAPKFVWTTGAWLIHDHLERGTPEQVARLEEAIGRGLIRWHGLPFTTHSELMSPALFRAGLSYAQELDARFGITTRAAKMTDVPGHTLGIVPLMAEAGLRFLHIGVNGASPVPDVPDVFRWRAPCGAEIVVMYQDDYGRTHLPDGMKDALSFAHTRDNMGPQSVSQVMDVWREIAGAFPDTRLRASSLDDYADLLWQKRETFPVVEAEIGDSWIYGAASDPQKLAGFRALQRVYDDFAAEGLTAPRRAFGRELAMVAEHTWGVDIKTYLRDTEAFDPPKFRAARATDYRFRFAEASWAEQRAYLDTAIASLDGPDRERAARAMAAVAAPARLTAPAGSARIDDMRVEVDPRTGDILSLSGPRGLRLEGAPLFGFRHHSYDHADLSRHLDSYLTTRPEWAILDHDKPGLERAAAARSCRVTPAFAGLFASETSLEVRTRLPSEAVAELGAPEEVSYVLTPGADRVDISLALRNKQANRMPEAGFLSVCPAGADGWSFLKTGQWIDPSQTVPRGGGALHAAFAARSRNRNRPLHLELLDSGLIAPAGADFMTFSKTTPKWDGGLDLVLYNNKWGTNFPMWWEGSIGIRLRLSLGG
ncbi:hypothetical protein OG2516_18025 [Oceanicola granulosus HTCC2516]|uniref:DUF5054 domain-containing protein n=1 Tax=Oceanicola granulosus (strain ATCC BAA-861 / DSM 15982 / KCTC 12143 / HTCC2516) TaxID=314256 RepID=Q2CEN9_OCEGH|nr:DUF5054 domain-containing protein [Oceanicola granulosus]EAR51093.1 hypothetical protein OG2516_18025 [Oceanicola granulosus HTCC2516]